MWLPPSARDAAASHRAQVLKAAVTAEAWTRELREIDPALSLIKASENATASGLKPGYWHVMRAVDDDVTSLLPVVGDDGEYVEPTSKLIEMVKAGDLQNEQAMRARRAFDKRKAAEREREKESARVERRDELVERFKHVEGVQVGWTGRRAA